MSVKNPHNLRVGSTLYYVPSRNIGAGESRNIIVTKVGNRWATCGEGWRAIRVDMVTLRVDGGSYSSPGRCYLSVDAYLEHCERCGLYSAIHRATQYVQPQHGVTTAQLREFAALIGAVKP